MASTVVSRWRKKLAERTATLRKSKRQDSALHSVLKKERAEVAAAKRVIARNTAKTATTRSRWHSGAKIVAGRDAGAFVPAGAKIVWHTTEGASAEGAIGAFVATGSWPHFTLNPKSGELYQHLPIDVAGRALEHPAGVPETNRAHAIQVELVGFAKDTAQWPDAMYANVAKLARWIEANAGVPRRCGVEFAEITHHLSDAGWTNYAGHCGHQHVPGNQHWDPGKFQIKKVLA